MIPTTTYGAPIASPALAAAEDRALALRAMIRGEEYAPPTSTTARPTPATPRGERRAYRAREILA